ncbi:AAA family ATPase [Rhodococcus ruber]|uniref:DnaB-like helicase C-terminal domain-containing protein n=1 Tax=Rhodococcus ruber TaxID=1830 RepID=UPI0022B2F629|nr:DnaB-like helicase C-terminal domain-containing protein [Rhodococcus ruber]MCZ4506349.1 AAA family ATPase [Rhodococcus ruber]
MTTTAYERVIDAFRNQGLIVQEKTAGVADCQAPGHSTRDRSVRVTATEGRVLIHSHSDPTEQVLDALNLAKSDLFDDPRGVGYTYDDGRVVGRTPDKRFFQKGNTGGSALYRASKLPTAVAEGVPILVVEGEQDVHALEAVGAVATCNAMGAGKAKQFDYTPLRGGTVTIVADKDDAGVAHAREVAAILLALDCTVSIVNAKVGKDAADHIAAGFRLDEWIPRTDLEAEAKLDDLLARVAAMRESNDAQTTADFLAKKLVTVHTTSEHNDSPTGQFTHIDNVIEEWLEWVDTPADQINVIRTPWEHLNEVIAGGLQPKALYLVAGRPGGGKSIIGTNIAQHAAENGIPSGVLSLEMANVQVGSRIMAAGAEARASQIQARELDDYNRGRIIEYIAKIQGKPLWISDQSTITPKAIRRQATAMKEQHDIQVLIVDYLQLVSSDDKRASREEQLTAISRELKLLAMDLDIAVVAAAQLNRSNVKDNRPPTIADLRGSGSLEQDADAVILIHHETEADGSPTGMVQLAMGKNRFGAQTTIELPWRAHMSRVG